MWKGVLKLKKLTTISVDARAKKRFDKVSQRLESKNASETLIKLIDYFEKADDKLFIELHDFFYKTMQQKYEDS